MTNGAACYVFNQTDSLICKAGRLVGLADCYAAIVLADNATFLLAVNRIAATRPLSEIILNVIMFVPTSAYTVGQHFPTSASAERATPKPHSLI